MNQNNYRYRITPFKFKIRAFNEIRSEINCGLFDQRFSPCTIEFGLNFVNSTSQPNPIVLFPRPDDPGKKNRLPSKPPRPDVFLRVPADVGRRKTQRVATNLQSNFIRTRPIRL